jgi:hypothetical protein
MGPIICILHQVLSRRRLVILKMDVEQVVCEGIA